MVNFHVVVDMEQECSLEMFLTKNIFHENIRPISVTRWKAVWIRARFKTTRSKV